MSELSPVEIYIRGDEAGAVEEVAFTGALSHPSLISTLKAAERPNWRIAASPPTYLAHGVCATSANLPDPFSEWAFLRWKDGQLPAWAPSNVTPAGWFPYAPRGRWLRTANDSLLTEAAANSAGQLLDESLSGTIHPTAEGQTRVADQLLARLAN